MLVNLFWSLLNLLPASVFCYKYINSKFLIIIGAISLVAAFIPVSILYKIQLFKSRKAYKKIGVEFISRFTQNGALVNAFIKKRYPGYKIVAATKESRNRLLQQTYMFEKFHLILLLFFTALSFHALINSQYWWAVILLTTNIIYNVYPCLLQQYTRLRLSVFKTL